MVDALFVWSVFRQIGVCLSECKVQNAKCKMSELRCDYNASL